MTELKLPQRWPQTAAWLRITDAGDLELELYDCSGESLGGDVAWIWSVSAAHFPALLRHRPPSIDFLETLAEAKPDIRALRDWIRSLGIPVEECFESQA
ncbi:MAG: hypothetical protein FJW36_14685 [Acidobacteria bacterium]|nr:hypothetical protein [Acidobacteriota bacterium]